MVDALSAAALKSHSLILPLGSLPLARIRQSGQDITSVAGCDLLLTNPRCSVLFTVHLPQINAISHSGLLVSQAAGTRFTYVPFCQRKRSFLQHKCNRMEGRSTQTHFLQTNTKSCRTHLKDSGHFLCSLLLK